MTVGEESQHAPLAVGQRLRSLGSDDHAGEHRVDVDTSRRDRLNGANEVFQGCLLQDDSAHAGGEPVEERRPVAMPGVEDDRCLRRDAARDLEAGDSG